MSGGQMVRMPGSVAYMAPWDGFETRRGLMPMKCLNLWLIENVYKNYSEVL